MYIWVEHPEDWEITEGQSHRHSLTARVAEIISSIQKRILSQRQKTAEENVQCSILASCVCIDIHTHAHTHTYIPTQMYVHRHAPILTKADQFLGGSDFLTTDKRSQCTPPLTAVPFPANGVRTRESRPPHCVLTDGYARPHGIVPIQQSYRWPWLSSMGHKAKVKDTNLRKEMVAMREWEGDKLG